MKYLVLALTIFAIGCSKSTTGTSQPSPAPSPAPKSEQPAPAPQEDPTTGDTPVTSAPEAPAAPEAEPAPKAGEVNCSNVDAEKFISRASGTWQPYASGLVAPSCGVVNGDESSRKFVTFNRNSQEVDEYQTSYGPAMSSVAACKEGAVPSGTRVGKSKAQAYELCQSAQLTGKYGADFYFLKVNDMYRVVGFKKDTQGRDVLMWSTTISNTPSVNATLIPHVDHNDFRSVSIVK